MDTKKRVFSITNQDELTILAPIVAGVSVGVIASAAIITKMYLNRKHCDKH